MSRTVTTTGSISTYLSSYDSDHSYNSLNNASRAYTNDIDSTSYASCYLNTGAGAETYMYFKFDTSSLPADATISSVSCVCRSKISNATAANVATKQIQMSSGTTLKGSATNLTTTVTKRNLSVGDWTTSELADARIRLYAVRGTSNVNTNYGIQIYAAQLTVSYSVTTTYYSVSASSRISGVSVSVSDAEKESGGNVTVTISGASGVEFTVTDNDVDVTSQITTSGTDYIYSISSISDDHVILVYDPYTPTGQEIYYKQNGSWVLVDKVYSKQNGSWTLVETIYKKDNGEWSS